MDPTWELPGSAVGMGCFYNCKALVGGNGTTWDSSKTSATYMRIDTEDALGYLMAKG